MAFKNVNTFFSGRTIKAKDLEIGEPIVGHVIRIEQYTNAQNQSFNNFVMRMQDSGEDVMIQTCGTLSYAVKDGKVKVGLLTQVTKTADKSAKVARTQFEVLQDDEDVIDVEAAPAKQAPQPANQAATDAAFDALAGGQPTTGSARSAIKSQASRMANSLKRG